MSDYWPDKRLNNIPFYDHFYFTISLWIFSRFSSLHKRIAWIQWIVEEVAFHSHFAYFLRTAFIIYNAIIEISFDSLIHSMFFILDNPVPIPGLVSTTCTNPTCLDCIFLTCYFQIFFFTDFIYSFCDREHERES